MDENKTDIIEPKRKSRENTKKNTEFVLSLFVVLSLALGVNFFLYTKIQELESQLQVATTHNQENKKNTATGAVGQAEFQMGSDCANTPNKEMCSSNRFCDITNPFNSLIFNKSEYEIKLQNVNPAKGKFILDGDRVIIKPSLYSQKTLEITEWDSRGNVKEFLFDGKRYNSEQCKTPEQEQQFVQTQLLEKFDKENIEKEKIKAEKAIKDKQDQERIAAEQKEEEKLKREKADHDNLQALMLRMQKWETEKLLKEQAEKDKLEIELLNKEMLKKEEMKKVKVKDKVKTF